MLQVATDHAFDLPPLEEDLGFLRRCYVLATLCHMAYSFQTDDLGSVSNIELPLAGALHDSVAVTTKLIHFKCVSPLCHCICGLICSAILQAHDQAVMSIQNADVIPQSSIRQSVEEC